MQEPTEFIEYKEPNKNEGYIQARLVFERSRCGDTHEGDESNWVKPFAPRTLTAVEIAVFREHVANENAEICFYEAAPFGILYSSLGEWLGGHQHHGVIMRLEKDS